MSLYLNPVPMQGGSGFVTGRRYQRTCGCDGRRASFALVDGIFSS